MRRRSRSTSARWPSWRKRWGPNILISQCLLTIWPCFMRRRRSRSSRHGSVSRQLRQRTQPRAQSRLGSERQKLAYLALFSKQTDFTLSLHSQALPHDPQALDLAFTTLLRRKGRGLDAMADTIGALRRRAAPEDQALFDQLAEARSQLALFMLKESGTDKPETYRARLKSLEDKVEELESALSARRPDFRAQAQPVTLNAVQSALPADSALVEFAVYTPQDPRNDKNKLPPRYLAYLLAAQGRPKWTDLGEAAPIDRAITSWRQALRDPRRTDVKRLARVVDEKVMRPVLALAQSGFGASSRLLIAPDGMLNLVPFAALVDRQGRYLVEGYSISYLMSGRDLLRSPVREPDNQDTVIVADPDYGAAENAIASRSRDVGLPAGLPQSAGSKSNTGSSLFPPIERDGGRSAGAQNDSAPGHSVYQRAGHRSRAQTTPQSGHSPRGHAWIFPPGSRDQAGWRARLDLGYSPVRGAL